MNAPFRLEARARQTRPVRARLTLDDYYTMSEIGLLDRFGRTELIDGEIIALNALHLPHALTHKQIFKALDRSVDASALPFEVLGEVTAEVDRHNGPLPDIAIVDLAAIEDQTKGAPIAAIKLLVEVSASSARRDLGKKRKLYARGGLPEYWVAVIPQGLFVRFADPKDGDYLRRDELPFAGGIESVTLPGVGIAAGVLGA